MNSKSNIEKVEEIYAAGGCPCDECCHEHKGEDEFPCSKCVHGSGSAEMFNYSKTEYRDNIIALMDKQAQKGMSKYGQTLEENDTLSTEQRIEHLQEELIDALQYCEHLKVSVKDELTANDFQRMAMRTASGMDYSMEKVNPLLLNGVMGLNGEAGECIDIVKKSLFQGHELDKEHLIEELGDTLWYAAVICTAIGIPFEVPLKYVIEKLFKRYPEGFDKSRSINRDKSES